MRLAELNKILKEKIQKESQLLEQPIAVQGNWKGFNKDNFETNISLENFEAIWDKVAIVTLNGKNLIVAKLHTKDIYIAGYENIITRQTKSGAEDKEVFTAIFKIYFEDQQNIGANLGYNNLYSVSGVYVSEDFRQQGVAGTMYKWFVDKLDINILGDKYQYFGARKLWTYLSNQIDIQVDLVDLNTNEILEKNIEIFHGVTDWEIDQSIWSFDGEKANIRPILTKIL